MRRSGFPGLAPALLAAVLLASPASAATLDISVVVDSAIGSQAGFFPVGETFLLHLEVDDAVADADGRPVFGEFPGAVLDFDLDFDSGIALSAGPLPSDSFFTTDNAVDTGGLTDTIAFAATQNLSGSVDGASLFSLGVTIASFDLGPPRLVVNQRVGDPILPVDAVILSLITQNGTTFLPTVINASGVPEPGTLLLLASGLLGLGVVSRSRPGA